MLHGGQVGNRLAYLPVSSHRIAERMENNMFEKETVYFNFRIIDMENGIQVIDESVKTPMDALTPEMQVEYMEMEEQLSFMERIKKSERREAERQRKISQNLFYKVGCLLGLV